MLRRCMGLFGILLWATTAQAAVQDRAVSWELDGTRFQGHILHPDSKTPLPGLLMVPNWMGVNASALEKARKLAEDIFAMDKIVEQTLDVYESAQKV